MAAPGEVPSDAAAAAATTAREAPAGTVAASPAAPGGFGGDGGGGGGAPAGKSAPKRAGAISKEDAVELNVHMKQAIAAMESGAWEKAQASLTEAARINPDNEQVNFFLGIMYLHTDPENARGRVDEAIPLFEAVIEANPKHADAHFQLAAALYTQSIANIDDVTETLKALFELDRKHKKGRSLAAHIGMEV
jgi:tetratricopeptide (TPR) repeat protein